MNVLKFSVKTACRKIVQYYRDKGEEIEENKNLIGLNF